jgi:hypothetical protein
LSAVSPRALRQPEPESWALGSLLARGLETNHCEVGMYRLPRAVVLAALLAVPAAVAAQVTLRPTPPPTVTAENSEWYQFREPAVVGGITYYPAGPQVFFDQNEMVRSGFYHGVPIYMRSTEEPFSRSYVPLAGGLMQPYERRRSGELAGTVGTTTPSFPVDRSPDLASLVTQSGPQAAGPPSVVAVDANQPPVGTTGRVEGAAPAARSPRPSRRALNAVYIIYNGQRWVNAGPPVEMDARFAINGRYFGLPVYEDRHDVTGTIYVPVSEAASALLTPYSRY